MTRRLLLLGWLAAATATATAADTAEASDLLRFTNGDQLHGSFAGLKDGTQALWLRDDMAGPVSFKTTQLRHIVLHGGRSPKPLASLAHVGMVNGDRIPGTVTAIDEEQITLDTSFAGVLRLPRKQVAMIAPNPLGGRVYYHGPFIENEWKMAHSAFPDGFPEAKPEAKNEAKEDAKDDTKEGDAKDDAKEDAKEGDAKDDANEDAKEDGKENNAKPADKEESKDKEQPEPARWAFAGSAWYWKNKQSGTALLRETGMPDRAVLRFDLAWKNRLCLAVAFHADFAPVARPKDDDEARKADQRAKLARGFAPGDATDLPRLFGNSYVLQMYSNYMMLYRSSVDEDGKASIEQVQLNNNNLRLVETGQAQVELRSNRRSGSIALFINDEFVAQWSEPAGNATADGSGFAGKGAGFGFVVQGDDCPVRISDVVVSEWNGMPDSARSLQIEDQDVVLMANGTDRYAGRVGGLDDTGRVKFEGKHGQFLFPLDEVAEIRFAQQRLAAAPDEPEKNLLVRFSPIGVLSGQPVSGDDSVITLVSPSAGRLNVSLASAVMLDFNASKNIIDDWNASF